MAKSDKSKKTSESKWETADPFTDDITLEQLVARAPFKDTKDAHGHSVTMAARIPEWLVRKITVLREAAKTPYQLDSDVVRDALFLGMSVLHLRYGKAASWGAESKMARVVDEAGEGTRVRDQFKDLIAGADALCEYGDDDKAAELLEDFIIAADMIENPWRRRTTFKLLKSSKTVQALLPRCSPEVQSLLKGALNA